jgi:hypothetical protein
VLVSGCGTAAPAPPSPAALPRPADVEGLLPPPPAPPRVPAGAPTFEDKIVQAGRCPGLPRGILTSHASYADRIWRIREGERAATEARVCEELRAEEHAAAAALLEAALKATTSARERADRERALRPWLVGGGALGGTLLWLGATWAAGRLGR